MSSNNLATKSDIANLFEELEKAKQESKVEEQETLNSTATSIKTVVGAIKQDEISNLFEGLEQASKEANVEIKKKLELNEKEKEKLNDFSALMEKVGSLSEKTEEENVSQITEVVTEFVEPEIVEEEVVEEKKPTTIIDEIVSTLDDMGQKTEIKEQLDEIQSLRKEFEKFKGIIQQQIIQERMKTGGLSGSGGGLDPNKIANHMIPAANNTFDLGSSSKQWINLFLSGSTLVIEGTQLAADELTVLDGVTPGTVSASKALIVDSNKDLSGFRNVNIGGDLTVSGVLSISSLALTSIDIDGGTDIGEAIVDADLFIVDNGAGGTNRKTAASRIKTYVSDITLTTAAQSNITSVGTLTTLTVDNIIVNGTTIGHTDDTDLITLADGVVTIAGNLTVSGTTTTVNQTVVNVTDAFVFEGANADAHETTFRVDEPTADRKASLQDKTGTIELLSGPILDGTDGSSTDAGDFMILNGTNSTSSNADDRLLYEDGTSDAIAVLASHGITLSGQGWNSFQFDNT